VKSLGSALVLLAGAALAAPSSAETPPPVKVTVDWSRVDRVSRTTAA
jgi:hypothetical protein